MDWIVKTEIDLNWIKAKINSFIEINLLNDIKNQLTFILNLIILKDYLLNFIDFLKWKKRKILLRDFLEMVICELDKLDKNDFEIKFIKKLCLDELKIVEDNIKLQDQLKSTLFINIPSLSKRLKSPILKYFYWDDESKYWNLTVWKILEEFYDSESFLKIPLLWKGLVNQFIGLLDELWVDHFYTKIL